VGGVGGAGGGGGGGGGCSALGSAGNGADGGGVLPTSAGFGGGDPPHAISTITIPATDQLPMALAHMMTEVLHLTTLAAPRRFYFGEFLVEQRILDRFQLFRVLQLKDRVPTARLGQCAVALGYVHKTAIEQAHIQFTLTDHADTEAFERVEEIEIVEAL
jgi:hypothetical protein